MSGIFNNSHCINLDSRPDRWQQAQAEFQKMNIPVQRFNALPGGATGCMESHIAIIRKAFKNNWEYVPVFEDDIRFLETDPRYYRMAFSELPKEWNLLYLGANVNTPLKRFSGSLLEAHRCWCAHAVIYHHSIYEKILAEYEKGIVKIIDKYLMGRVQPKNKSYITDRLCVTQYPGNSDIENKLVDYSLIETNFIRYATKC